MKRPLTRHLAKLLFWTILLIKSAIVYISYNIPAQAGTIEKLAPLILMAYVAVLSWLVADALIKTLNAYWDEYQDEHQDDYDDRRDW